MNNASEQSSQIKSKERVAAHGEVFTNAREVNAMLDLVKPETERIDSRFLEPACGDGNFLIEILRRKLAICEDRVKAKQYTQLQYEHDAIWAISSIYGIELLADNATAIDTAKMETPEPVAPAKEVAPEEELHPVESYVEPWEHLKVGDIFAHKSIGTGEVISLDEKYLIVKFSDREAKFLYPNAFEKGYLSMDGS